ncbi:MAG: carbohydrate ABC transporter permease [Clostridia bacterium]|nr:carbohydrate ABC transporter permease [Clostridia bacterium]
MTQNMENKPQVKRETKNKIRVDFERTSLKERLKAKYGSAYFFKNTLWYIFRLLLLIGIAFVVLQPFYTMLINSFMAPEDFVDATVVKVPKHLSMGIYKAIITDLGYFKIFFSTLGLSLLTALLQTFTACLVGYGLAKFKFRGNKIVFFAVILTLVIPHGTLQSAIYHRFCYFDFFGILKFLSGGTHTGIEWLDGILSKIHILNLPNGINMLNTIMPLVVLSIFGLAFKNGLYIFLLRQFFRGVPDELEESAYLDGANTFRTFIQVILPLSVPMMITVFLFAFCWQWTDDFYIRLFFISPDKPPLMTYITKTIPFPSLQATYTQVTHSSGSYSQAMRFGCGMMACTPLIILYLFCQRHLVQGIERSGIIG